MAQGDARKFKVGDIVVTNYLAKRYGVWQFVGEMEIVEIYGLSVRINVLTADDQSDVGQTWWAEAKHLKKVLVTKKSVDEAIKSIMARA